jgi:hypothetical protein
MMLLSSRFYSKDVDDLNGLFGEVVYETFTDWNVLSMLFLQWSTSIRENRSVNFLRR